MPKLFSCCTSRKRAPDGGGSESLFQGGSHLNSNETISMPCDRCHVSHDLPANSYVFICNACRSVNRILQNGTQKYTSTIDASGNDVIILRLSERNFEIFDRTKSGELALCSVCMESVGDMLLLPCRHGGLCEDCAKYILDNKAVGGSRCPKCREEITSLGRVAMIFSDIMKVVQVHHATEIQRKKAPPKVPPAPGLRKKQRVQESTKQ